jgi:RNA-directed DNA polymerase
MSNFDINQSIKKIIDELDFKKAFDRVKHDSRFDFLQFPVEINIFEEYYEDNINYLKETINQGTYSIKSLRKIWVPKSGFFLRPGSIPYLEDRILFQAIVDRIAPELENLLPPFEQQIVFSSRLSQDPQSKSMFRNLRNLWLQFQAKAVAYCEEPNTHYVLESDIASYFENIDLRLLADTLDSSGLSPKYIDVIQQILQKWANGRTRGLPQMLAPCTLLGNVYLSQVDKNMSLYGYKYIRYVDDMRVFVSSEIELRKALLDLTEELKNCYLTSVLDKQNPLR